MQKQLQTHLQPTGRKLKPKTNGGIALGINRIALKGLFFLACLLSSGSIYAQVADYTMTAGTTGVLEDMSTGTTQLVASNSDDGISSIQPIGFTFTLNGVAYTDFSAGANGLVRLGTTVVDDEWINNFATTAVGYPMIAPYWDDLATGSVAGGGFVNYKLMGTSPNRKLVIEWFVTVPRITSGPANAKFQLWLNETSNSIQFVYGAGMVANTAEGGASIGLASSATDFISVTSTTNSASTTAINNTNTAAIPAGTIYTFNQPVVTSVDVQAFALASPGTTGCFGPNQTVTVTIKNKGTTPLNFATSPVTVNVSVTGPNGTTNFTPVTVNTGTPLAPNANQDVIVSTTFDMSAAGTYTFSGTATSPGDGNALNDVLPTTTRTISAAAVLPQRLDFTGFTGTNLTTVFPNWREGVGATAPAGTTSVWGSSTGLGVPGNVTAKVNLFVATKREWIVGPKVVPTATSVFQFKAAVTNFNNLLPDPDGMGSDDMVQVMVSTDCGGTYTPIYTINAATGLTNVLTEQSVSLSAYAGQNIILAIFATEGTVDNNPNDYDFHIDDIFIGTPPTTDLAITAFVTPSTTGCYTGSEPVTVTVKNTGIAPINFANNAGSITVKVNGNATSITSPALTGTLAVGATQDITVGNINMLTAGNYALTAISSVVGDGNAANDTLRTSRTVAPIRALSQRLDFTGFTGGNLTTLFPNWTEATGATVPAGTTSTWASSAPVQTAAFGTTTAKINLDAASDRAWIVGPKITPTATTSLVFKAAITDFNSAAADANGMVGSDDMVQVMVSTDCGVTFTPIYTYDATTTPALTENLTTNTLSLATYAGQNIIVAFFATEGAINDNPHDYDFHIDDIFIGTLPTTDVAVTAFNSPSTTGCYGTSENITVSITNTGIAPVSFGSNPGNIRVFVNGSATPITSPALTGTLAVGATQTVSVGNLNMSAAGTYNLTAIVKITGDTEAYNDTLKTTRTVAPVIALPQKVDFAGYTGGNLATISPNWFEATGTTIPAGTTSAWINSAAAQTTALGSITAKINFPTAAATIRNEWIVSPKVAVTSATHLLFKAAVTTSAGTAAATMNPTDSVLIMYSVNCGQTFNRFSSLTATNNLPSTLQSFDLNVGTLAGQNVIFAFKAKNDLPRPATAYDLHLDDIEIKNMFANDISPVSVIVPKSVCRTTAEQICVIVKNVGTATLNNIPVAYRVNTGAVVTGIVPGPLAAGDTVRFCFNTPANLNAAGTYTITTYTNLTGDNFVANDTLRSTVTSLTSTISAAPVAICGPGVATLTATSNNAGATINWYTSATATTPVATGSTFSPTISATTPYFVEAGTTTENVGQASTTGANGKNTTGGLIFNVTIPVLLNSVVVYSDLAAGGTLTVNLRNSANAIINTATITLPPVTAMTPITVPLNFNIPVGTGYTLENGSGTSLFRETTATYPMNSPSGAVSITNGTLAGFYYYFFNWSISLGCPSSRIQVVASVNSVPTPAFTGLNAAYCSNAAPVTLASTLAGSTFTIDGTAATTLNPAILSAGAHTVIVSNTANGCTGTATQTVTINAAPTAPTSVLNASYCKNAAAVSLSGGLNTYTVDGTAATTFDPATLALGPHTVVVSTTSGGCTATTSQTVTINAVPAAPTSVLSATYCQNAPAVTLVGGVNSYTIDGTAATTFNPAILTVGAHAIVVSTTNSGCTSTTNQTVTVVATPTTPTITASGLTLTSSAATGNQWYLGGNIITGATGATHTATVNGNYTVVSTAGGCSSATSAIFTVSNVGISKDMAGRSVSVYPNPTSGMFKVKLTGFTKEVAINLYTLTGQLIASEIALGNTKEFTKNMDVKHLPAGVYLLKVSSENAVQVTRLTVE